MESQEGSSLRLSRFIVVQMALKAAIELDVFNILANAGPQAQLSASQIVSKIPTTNPDASNALERILKWLSVNSILSTSVRPSSISNETGGVTQNQERVYGLTEQTRLLATNSGSLAALEVLYESETEIVESLRVLKHAVLESGLSPFEKAYGMSFFEYLSNNPRSPLNQNFNEIMSRSSKIFFDQFLKVYNGFQDLEELMDVGGNTGSSLELIISMYPQIHGINFDLPHVIQDLSKSSAGIEHVAGNMFECLPQAKTILLKWILHDWDDKHCTKILRNCFDALPNNGKVIVISSIVPLEQENNIDPVITQWDIGMMALFGGKERTMAEFDALAKAAGFAETKLVLIRELTNVIEFYKRVADE